MRTGACLVALALVACTENVAPPLEAPRLLAPLSGSSATTARPMLQWVLPAEADGARVELCADRSCATVLGTIDAQSTSGAPGTDLPPGPVFWRAFARSGTQISREASATWELFVRRRSASIRTAWGATLDMNGDGHPDLVVGSPESSVAHLYQGTATAIDESTGTELARSGPEADFGAAIASAGDLNGDGFADLAVGAPASGHVYVYFGDASDLSSVMRSGAVGFGASVASAGDVNEDGYGDLAVAGEVGRITIFFGSSHGPSAMPSLVLDASVHGTLGTTLGGATDVNGDGHTDLVVSGTSAATSLPCAFLFLGAAAGLATVPLLLSGPDAIDSGFGAAIATGSDVNGDGYADVVVGAPFAEDASRRGSAYVFLGAAGGLETTISLVIDDPSDVSDGDGHFGSAVASASDVNGDGYDDLVIGAEAGHLGRGAAYFYEGSTDGLASSVGSLFLGAESMGRFGASVGGAGDVDHDGFSELVIGAPGEGRVFVFTGNASGPAQPRAAVLTSAEPGFGETFASHPR